MTFLRHAARHIQQTVYDYAHAQMAALNWFDTGHVPFGLPVPTFTVGRPFIGSQLDNKIKAGMVVLSMGNEFPPDLQELGGPLSVQEYPFFFDVFMEEEGAALALACDIRDAFLGRHATSTTGVAVVDQITGTPVTGWRLSFEEVERVAPEHKFPLAWQSVHVTASCEFQEVLW